MNHKAGRPKKGLKRPKTFTLRVTDEERDFIHEHGGAEFIRSLIFAGMRKKTDEYIPEERACTK